MIAGVLEVRDASGRYVAPPQSTPEPRPAGPWESNGAAAVERIHVVCAWCSDVMQRGDDPARASHGICPRCAEGWK